uniref:Uncharacterized protein n=1 Tax=Actinobacteria phage HS02 TaxID=3056388 RepID=A0AA49X3Z1_9VIRU|nr:MAG: hypothetical protein [Actinobacteria phage HS02]
MTDLTTTHLQHLLDRTSPGPWETIEAYPDGTPRSDMSRQIRSADGEYLGIMYELDVRLAAAAPTLAQELIRLRGEIKGLIAAMEVKAATGESQSPAVIAGYLKENVLGETNE